MSTEPPGWPATDSALCQLPTRTSTRFPRTIGRATNVATRPRACANSAERGDWPCLRASTRRRRVGFSVLSLLTSFPPELLLPGTRRTGRRIRERNDEPSYLRDRAGRALSIGQNAPNLRHEHRSGRAPLRRHGRSPGITARGSHRKHGGTRDGQGHDGRGAIAPSGAIFGCMIMEGGNPASLIAPPALLLIIVGTFGASCAGTSLEGALGFAQGHGHAVREPRERPDRSRRAHERLRRRRPARRRAGARVEARRRGRRAGEEGPAAAVRRRRARPGAGVAVRAGDGREEPPQGAGRVLEQDGRLRADPRHHRHGPRPHPHAATRSVAIPPSSATSSRPRSSPRSSASCSPTSSSCRSARR